MHPEQFIARLAARLELPKLTFNDEHVCRLVLDDHDVIDMEWVEGDAAIHIYAVLHTRASDLKPRFAELLAANLFGRATHDAVLALDADRDEILLTRSFELEHLDLQWFVQQLESFVDSVSTWKQRLDQHPIYSDSASGQEPSYIEHASGLMRV